MEAQNLLDCTLTEPQALIMHWQSSHWALVANPNDLIEFKDYNAVVMTELTFTSRQHRHHHHDLPIYLEDLKTAESVWAYFS